MIIYFIILDESGEKRDQVGSEHGKEEWKEKWSNKRKECRFGKRKEK